MSRPYTGGRKRIGVGTKSVRRARLVMEEVLGRKLRPGEVVHHRDGNPENDDPENLELLPSTAAHLQLHRAKVNEAIKVRWSDVPELWPCKGCREPFKLSPPQRTKYRRGKRHFYCSLDCWYKYGR